MQLLIISFKLLFILFDNYYDLPKLKFNIYICIFLII